MIQSGIDQPAIRVGAGPDAARREESGDSGNLDLLRSVAVLLVFGFHLSAILSNGALSEKPINLLMLGHWGVLIFFVHTSYVLMFSLDRQMRRSRAQELFRDFMVRRAFRLLPLSTLAVVGVIAFKLPVADLPFRLAQFRPFVVISNLLLVQNLTKTDSVLVTLWSLPYEVQMCFVLPALFLLARRYRSVVPLLALWTASTFVARAWLPRLGPFYDMPIYVPCFLSGVIGYNLARARRSNQPFILWPVTITALSIIYLMHPSLSVGWACCLALGLLIPVFEELPRGVVRRAVQVIARYSYGIYLAHIVCIWVAFVMLSRSAWPVQWLVFLTMAIVLPVAAYHLIEAPMIGLGVRLVQRLQRRRLVHPGSLALEADPAT